MHNKLLVSNYTAIKQLIYSHLLNVISIYTKKQEIQCIKYKELPLYKGRDKRRILYITGIAQQLAKSQNQEAVKIASAIASDLSATCEDVFTVQIVPPGWIHLELTHPILAAWLQNLAVGNLGEEGAISTRETKIHNPQSKTENPSSLFIVQYAHARCCSLLRLADREGLIQLSKGFPNTSENFEQQKPLLGALVPAFWSLIFPNPIPWLNCEHQLSLNHPAERHLISDLVQVVDDLHCHTFASSVNWQKAALDLSQAFESFWCNCRIWGEVKITSLELAQARLGLIMVTQRMFRLLLEEKLGVFAPLEL
ncbi:MAG: glutamate acetyltransferase [Mojavia pulchra JT2-VF2]|uniref:Glutamate acetyltransferase n=1 Tax=Mojavia pulchra JT2-VF2 TaxID=287848 RepID=A0A951Q1G3_9NOST|nr:glutamate acetyltransferase [Mojavia pulchra JT2-VF2]